VKLRVPNSLEDITVAQYRKLAKIDITKDETQWLKETVSILCGLDESLVNKLSLTELEKIGTVVNKITNADTNDQELVKKIDYKGKRYGFHPNLSKLTVGEFADLETYCAAGFFEHINEIISILYRPIKQEHKDFYQIEEYTGEVFPDYWDDLKMHVVLGATNFFLSIGETLTTDLVSSLQVKEKLTLSRKNGAGT
tara:strand:+ start:286 stop:873 length:588 start_codon:yes stop_codon:yes gene_type:complete